jgi:hypothetical protein
MSHGWTPALPDRIGVCHGAGRYSVGPEDQLTAGALRTLELGSRVLKLWFRAPISHSFPLTSGWPEITQLTDLAQAPLMRGVLDLPFTTFFLSCDAVGVPDTWNRPQSDDDAAREASQLEDLTRHLLTTYADRDVTFVVQNWEGDWAVRAGFDVNAQPQPGALDAMISRLDNRQRAIERGRAAVPNSRARMLQAAEVNLVFGGGHPSLAVTKAVLPDTRLDLYSYSAWETTSENNGARLIEALELIRDNTKPSEAFGRDNVFIGEFGAQEVWLGKDEAAAITRRTVDDALAFGCPYVLYWEIFDNETLAQPIAGVDYPGFWVLRPDGSRSAQGDVLAGYLSGAAT